MQMKKKSGKSMSAAKKAPMPAAKNQPTLKTYPKTKYPAWCMVPPAAGDAQHKVVNTKDYWWCIKHQIWARHKPGDCRMNKPRGTSTTSKVSFGSSKPRSSPARASNGSPTLQLNSAYAATWQQEEEEDSSE